MTEPIRDDVRRRRRREAIRRRRRRRRVLAAVVVAAVTGAVISTVVASGSSGRRTASTKPHAAAAEGGAAPQKAEHPQKAERPQKPEYPNAQPSPSQWASRKTNAGQPGKPSSRTSCRSVVHIGDSTSEGLVSTDYLPDPKDRIGAQYARVGAGTFRPEISGARSIVEGLPGQTNAYDVARELVSQGYRGCWVLALGTNDSADVAVGSTVDLAQRIERMMAAIGHQPVMWVNVKSLLGSGAYAEANMERWDAALADACPRYPNMRVFDWAALVKDGWFISDGIHFTSAGYEARARLIADALAQAFPASGAHAGCVVR